MQWLAKLSVKRPVLATVLVLLILVIGIGGYTSLGVDRFPKVDFPTVLITTKVPGASPEEIETDVSQKIEEEVNSISGIDQLKSTSSEGISIVVVQFVLEKDGDVGTQEVRDKVATVMSKLPKNAESPVIMKMSSDGTPVVQLAVHANKDTRAITEVADKTIRRQLETVSGVGRVDLIGGAKREIEITLDTAALREHGLTAIDVQRAVQSENATVPAGRVESGPIDRTMRIKGRAESIGELEDLVVAKQNGHPIKLRDVAQVSDGAEQQDTAAFVNGSPTILLSVYKQSGTNTVAVVDAVQERVAELKHQLPEGYSLEVSRDESLTIRTSTDAVKEHLILGGIFAAIVVLLFLGNVRSTIIAAIAIPVSVIGTFALMAYEGFTLDTITLLALALSVGIVIDDAIVVLENIVRFIEEKGMKPFPAAILATKEIGMAVLATTLSLIAVFLPVAFMSGIVGRFLKSFGLTMSFAIAVSLFVSFSLTPMLSSRWFKKHDPEAEKTKKKPVLMRLVDVAYKPIENVYMVVLAWVMKRRWIVVALSVLTLGSCIPLGKAVPKGFLPKNDEARFEIELRTPEGTSMEATAIAGERIAREMRGLEGVEHTVVTVGDNSEKQLNVSRIYIALLDPDKRKMSQDEIMARTRSEILSKQPKEYRANLYEIGFFGGGSKDAAIISYALSGDDLAILGDKASKAADELRAIPGAVDVDTSLVVGKPELHVRIDRDRAADLGVDVMDIAQTLRLLVGGDDISTFEDKGESYDVHVRARADQRDDARRLDLVTVPSRKLGTVPLLSVVKIDDEKGPSQIQRLNRRRQVTITGNVAVGYAEGDVTKAFEKRIASLGLPPGYKLETLGRSKEMGRAMKAFGIAFFLSFLFMYLILSAQFESWLHPVTILLSLPLTVPFALVSLLIFHQALDIFSMLGILVLFGVVKKNSILQIEHANQLRREGMPKLEAILRANKDRLRPILMTTLAFVAGMVPLVFSHGIGAGFNKATAGVIVGGQTLSLLLTLLATPVAYSLFDDAGLWLKSKFGRKADADETGESEIAALEGAE